MPGEIELLPCPFCGSPAAIEQDGKRWSVGCSESGETPGTQECIGYISLTTFPRKAEAVAAWNRRTPRTTEDGNGG